MCHFPFLASTLTVLAMVLSGKDDNGRNGSQLSSSLVGSVTKAHAVVQSVTPPRVFIVSGKPCAPSLPHSPSHLF